MADAWEPGSEIEENRHNWADEPKHFPPVEPGSRDRDRPTVIDLFSGPGGISTGLERAGFEAVLGVDIHEPSVRTYRQNHPQAHTILGDIRRINKRDDDERDIFDVVDSDDAVESTMLSTVAEEALDGDDLDLLTAGIPCQGFSIANRKQHDEDERNYLFEEFIRGVRLLDPEYVLIENVSTMKAADDGGFVEAIEECLDRLGYTVDHRILNAADYGVPQTRRRLFFLGTRTDAPVLWPRPTHEEDHRTAAEAIGDLPALAAGEAATERDAAGDGDLTEYQRLMRERDAGVADGRDTAADDGESGDDDGARDDSDGSDGTRDDSDADASLANHQAPNHRQTTIDRVEGTDPGEPMYDRFRQRIRLHPDEPGPTIIAGGIRPQFQYGHFEQSRGLSVRERARLQSFPDSFRFEGGTVQGRVQTGMAVPPLLAERIGESVRRGRDAQALVDAVREADVSGDAVRPWMRSDADPTPFEVLAGELLLGDAAGDAVDGDTADGDATDGDVSAAYAELIERYPDANAVSEADSEALATLLERHGIDDADARIADLRDICTQLLFRDLPTTVERLTDLPHVTPAVAATVVCFGVGDPAPVVDERVARVYGRYYGLGSDDVDRSFGSDLGDDDEYLRELAEAIAPEDDPAAYVRSLLAFASETCTAASPRCDACPARLRCRFPRDD
ncbi:DNA (cytosine-5-)-methyltransferase [Halobaculum sp. CBA1158]|uniref:DNA cytosine methyltransferase n=1 Tax=Halobaculum sp. CBA1158 TaxID=2904243 RepID=UPI001F34C1EB|nr:DNA cytosine methyltransferase [Halobaculum sp. CBA1158]UIP00629.1 DNA (cytosine-5-)-methyltransferase [Halobaculum sp. CBA1158]